MARLTPGPLIDPSDLLFPDEFVGFASQTIVGAQLIEDRSWLVTDETAAWYLDAIGALFQEAAFLVTDIGVDGDADYQTGYGPLFTINPRFVGDTAICPTNQLPYVGQFVGVTVPPDANDATARSLITSEQGMQRGTAASIVAAAKRFLTGTQSIVDLPRVRPDGSPDADWFVLIVRPEEVTNATDLIAAVNAVKPAGLMWTLVQTDSFTWVAATHTWAGETMTWDQTGSIAP